MWLLCETLFQFFQNTHKICTHPQCLPITSKMKVLWWLHTEALIVKSLQTFHLLLLSLNILKPTCLPLCRGCDGIYYFNNAMQGAVSANGHISSTEVIVDGAHHADNVEMGGVICFICCDFSWNQIQTSFFLKKKCLYGIFILIIY